MLRAFFADSKAVERLRGSAVGAHLDSFAAAVSALGYQGSTVRLQLWLLRDFGLWLGRRGVSLTELDEAILERFVARCRRRGRLRRGDAATVRRFLTHLREQGVARPAEILRNDSAIAQLLRRHEIYLKQERGLTPTTVRNYQPFVLRFLTERFGDGPLLLDRLVPSDLEGFVVHHAASMCPKRAQLMISALRSFLRFLLHHGDIVIDLAARVPSVASRRLATVPKYISLQEVERLLTSCNRSTAVGRRDYAILLLLARLGLRAGEVLTLELDDIYWKAGEIVVHGKGHTRDRLPLPQDVGEALANYLQDRAQSKDRHVFLCARAPRRAFHHPSSVSTIVCRALQRAGLQSPTKGAHLLRHSLATGMLRGGATMAEIAEVLRHRSPQTTEIYAKVDILGLRSLAQPWPGDGGGQ